MRDKNSWKRELLRGQWSMQRLDMFVLKIICLEMIIDFPLEIFKSELVWFWYDVSGETSEMAAQDVTFKQPAQTFYKWIKGFWPSQHDEYALGQLPISIDSLVMKTSFVFLDLHANCWRTEDHMPYRLDKRKMVLQKKAHLISIENIAFLLMLYAQFECLHASNYIGAI